MRLRDLQSILSQHGYICIRSTKHMTWSNGLINVTVPHSKELSKFTAKQILRQINVRINH